MRDVSTRRALLKGASGAGLAVLLQRGQAWAAPTGAEDAGADAAADATPAAPLPERTLAPFVAALPVPPTIDLTAGGAVTLTMANGLHRFHPRLGRTKTFGINGSYLGPTLVTREGVPVSVTFLNQLGAHPLARSIDLTLMGASRADRLRPRTTIHLHGGNTAPADDGSPEDTFRPGQSHTYQYGNTQEAATLWYHDHSMGITRLNVLAGLAGMYLLRGDKEPSLKIPMGAPYELPLVLQDRSFDTLARFDYPPAPWEPEFFGNLPVVNGAIAPNLDVDRTLYRFRVVNGSNARFWNLSMSETLPWYLIGSDGGFLDAPVPLANLLLAPGERADLLVDFAYKAPGARIRLLNDARTPYPDGEGAPIPEVMQFTVRDVAAAPKTIPRRLRDGKKGALPKLPPDKAVARVRNLTLTEMLDDQGMPIHVLLNRMAYMDPVTEDPRVDTWELWNIINTTVDAHPIHVHLVQYRLKNRQRFDVAGYLAGYDGMMFPPPAAEPFLVGPTLAPGPGEVGWKDTVVAPPGQVTRLLIPFGAKVPDGPTAAKASHTGNYVWHCHILEHEDNDMMRPLTVQP